jgi:hypothetical protein
MVILSGYQLTILRFCYRRIEDCNDCNPNNWCNAAAARARRNALLVTAQRSHSLREALALYLVAICRQGNPGTPNLGRTLLATMSA